MISANSELKFQLLTQIGAVGKEQSLLPFANSAIDEIILQLEQTNPIPQPLKSDNFAYLLGDWQLIYASNGTVITRPLIELTSALRSSICIQKIWQSLHNFEGQIRADNQALIELFLLGEYRLEASGIWQPETDGLTSRVSFQSFAFQATMFLAQTNWNLPQLKLPVLDLMQNSAVWLTSYLDQDLRIGRGATGNLFVFQR